MANTYRWFKIGEANAEIERLEKALKDEQSKVSASTSNDSEIAEQATLLQKENESLRAQISAITAERNSAISERDTARTEAKTAADKLTGFDEKVKSAASKEALTIVASQGAAPIKAEPSENPAAQQTNTKATSPEARRARWAADIKRVKEASGMA